MTEERFNEIVHPSWKRILFDLFNDKRMGNLLVFLEEEMKKGYTIYPERDNVFKAFKLCSYDDLKCTIIGQDPFHQKGQATGLCFAVNNDVKPPPSLVNIIKELEDNYEEVPSNSMFLKSVKMKLVNTNLESWAKQGCLMLNTALTVRANVPASHSKQWRWFTEEVIRRIQESTSGLIFVRWGNHAKEFKVTVNHITLDAGHPSPLNTSVPFRGNGHFKKINEILQGQNGKENQINWFL